MKKQILNNTPVEEYKTCGRIVHVKREDLCTQPPGPPFSKCRGLYQHMVWLKGQGFDTVGYAESSISMAGWGVAWCAKMLKMKAIIFDPQYVNETPELLKLHRKKWKKYGAELIPLPAGRTKVNFHIAQNHLSEHYGKNAIMLPIGLRVPATVDATAEEWKRTMEVIKPDVTVVPVGSGTIFAGIIKAAQEGDGDLIGVMCYSGNQYGKMKGIYSKSGKVPGGLFNRVEVDVSLVNPGWEYTEFSGTSCPFPCHPYYDLKAWEWLCSNISTLPNKILFWNIGAEPLML